MLASRSLRIKDKIPRRLLVLGHNLSGATFHSTVLSTLLRYSYRCQSDLFDTTCFLVGHTSISTRWTHNRHFFVSVNVTQFESSESSGLNEGTPVTDHQLRRPHPVAAGAADPARRRRFSDASRQQRRATTLTRSDGRVTVTTARVGHQNAFV